MRPKAFLTISERNGCNMKKSEIKIGGIPAILWGESSDRLYIHVHGKMSRKEYAEDFACIANAKGIQTLSFDLPEHGERKNSKERLDVWNGIRDLKTISDYAFQGWKELSLFACSIGAYFSLNTYSGMKFEKCLFQSPVVDMEYLVNQMMLWFDVTPERLEEEKEIPNAVDPLRWDYYQYILSHPVKEWNIPTAILYGAKDELQSREVMEAFARRFSCELTVSENSEHPFMTSGDKIIVDRWLAENI